MKNGGLQQVSITLLDEHRAWLNIGESKLLELEKDKDGVRAIHKQPRSEPIIADARALLRALELLLTA